MNKLLSIIVPVYNEEKVALSSLPAIFALNINKEVIVINDGSTDQTQAVLENFTKQYQFKLIEQLTNQGKGAAVKRGLEEMTGDYFIICDADLEYDPQDIISLFKEIEKDASENLVIYGSRFLKNKTLTFHYLVNRFLTGLTNWLFGSRLTDMETCFKLIPASALKKLRLSGQRFEIEPEITAQLLKNNYQLKELPINYRRRGYKDGKKIKARDGLLAIKTLIKEKFFKAI